MCHYYIGFYIGNGKETGVLVKYTTISSKL